MFNWDVNQKLAYAADQLDVFCMRDALEAGADPQHPDQYGNHGYILELVMTWNHGYDLVMTAEPQQAAAVRLLAEFGGVDTATASGNLMFAVEEGVGVVLMQALLDVGADVNAVESHGRRCCLHSAAESTSWDPEDPARLRLLLNAGADPTVTNNGGQTPLAVALQRMRGGYHLTRAHEKVAKTFVKLLARAEAWWRRRHLLLAVRSRYCPAAAASAAGGSSGSAAAASS